MSFIYGATGGTMLALIPQAVRDGHPVILLGLGLLLAGLGFKIAAFPFHMWAPDTYEAATTPFIAWLSVAPKTAGFVAILRIYVEGLGTTAELWMPILATLAGMTIVTGNLMAIPQKNIKRLLAYSGVAHIGYMLIGVAAVSSAGVAMLLFYLIAYLFGNIGTFLVVEAVAQSEKSDGIDAYRGLAQRSPLLALAMLVFLLVARRHSVRRRLLGEAVYLPGRRRARDVRPGLPRRGADGGGAVLLPARRAADVHRSAHANASRCRCRVCSARRSRCARSAWSAWGSIPARGSCSPSASRRRCFPDYGGSEDPPLCVRETCCPRYRVRRAGARLMKLALTCLAVLVAVRPAFAERATSPSDATVLVRLVGSLRAEIDNVGQKSVVTRDRVEIGSGSGFVISPDGHVLTNEHVVSNREITLNEPNRKVVIRLNVSKIEVCFPPESAAARGGTTPCAEATISAADPDLDLAVLYVGSSNQPYLALGDSDVVTPGQPVQALGFPFGRTLDIGRDTLDSVVPEITTTAGTISALRANNAGERRFLQIDGNVNPGSSGGPIVNKDGFVVGVVVARLRDAGNIAFAIPINQAKSFIESRGLDQLMPTRRLRLGGLQRFDAKGIALRLPEGLVRCIAVQITPGHRLEPDRDHDARRSRDVAMDAQSARAGAGQDAGLRARSRSRPTRAGRRAWAGRPRSWAGPLATPRTAPRSAWPMR